MWSRPVKHCRLPLPSAYTGQAPLDACTLYQQCGDKASGGHTRVRASSHESFKVAPVLPEDSPELTWCLQESC